MITVALDSCEQAMARACAQWRLDRTRREELGDGHGETGNKGLHRDLPGALGEMAFAKYSGAYWGGGAELWQAADVGDYQVRTTTHMSGSLIVFKEDDPETKLALVIAPKHGHIAGLGSRLYIVGWFTPEEARSRDDWKVSPETHSRLVRPGSPEQWWVRQSELHQFAEDTT